MEYILNSRTQGIDFAPYAAYLDSIRDRLPPHVHAFAANPGHYDLTSRSSLHDAWLENLTVREVSEGARREQRRTEITLSLLGPFHDLRIHLHYLGVNRYFLAAPARGGKALSPIHAHGDLFTHEVRLAVNGLVIHELLFENDCNFLIECADLRHSEEILK